jgi:hypothetical protein
MLTSFHLTMSVNRASREHRQSITRESTESQQSITRESTESQLSITRESTESQQSVNRASTECQQSINRASTERQQSINILGCCIMYDSKAVLWHLPIINLLAAFVGKGEGDMVTAAVCKWASTEHQRFWVLHLLSSKGCSTAVIHNWSFGHLCR